MVLGHIRLIVYLVVFCITVGPCGFALAQGDMATPEDLQKIMDAEKSSKKKSVSPATKKSKLKNKAKSKPKPKPKPRDTGQDATVKVDGAAIYQVANFDSPVLEYLDQDKKIKISKKVYPGIGGLGAFYKIRIRPGVYGFIPDTDVLLEGGKSAVKKSEEESSGDPLKLQDQLIDETPMEEEGDDSLYLTRFIGPAYYSYNYAETLRGTTEEAQTPMLGVKIVGPTEIMGGIPLDIDILFTTTAPDFYTEIANKTSGFMLFSNALIAIPMYESKRMIVSYGGGLVLRYSSWDVTLKSNPDKKPVDSQEVGLGVAGMLGAGFTLSPKILLKGDAKYVFEKEKYLGFGIGLLFRY